MKQIIPTALLAVVIIGTVGCVSQDDSEIQSGDQPEPYVLQRENTKLKKKVNILQARNKTLVDHNRSLSQRAKKLSGKLHTLQRDYEKQKEILEHLSTLPAKLELHRKEVKSCKMKIFRLNREILQLKGKLAELQPASKPKPAPR